MSFSTTLTTDRVLVMSIVFIVIGVVLVCDCFRMLEVPMIASSKIIMAINLKKL